MLKKSLSRILRPENRPRKEKRKEMVNTLELEKDKEKTGR